MCDCCPLLATAGCVCIFHQGLAPACVPGRLGPLVSQEAALNVMGTTVSQCLGGNEATSPGSLPVQCAPNPTLCEVGIGFPDPVHCHVLASSQPWPSRLAPLGDKLRVTPSPSLTGKDAPQPGQHLVLSVFSLWALLPGQWWCLPALICFSLVTWDVEST